MFNITGSICGDSSRISSSTASCDPACSDYDDSISSYVLSPGGRRYYSPSVGENSVYHSSIKFMTAWIKPSYFTRIMVV